MRTNELPNVHEPTTVFKKNQKLAYDLKIQPAGQNIHRHYCAGACGIFPAGVYV